MFFQSDLLHLFVPFFPGLRTHAIHTSLASVIMFIKRRLGNFVLVRAGSLDIYDKRKRDVPLVTRH